MTDQTPKPDYAEADRWAANAHEGIDRTDWLHAQAYLVLRAEVESLKAQLEANHEWEARVDRELEIEQELHLTTLQRAEKAEAEVERMRAWVQSLLMRHNANHGDGQSETCNDCAEARAIIAVREREKS